MTSESKSTLEHTDGSPGASASGGSPSHGGAHEIPVERPGARAESGAEGREEAHNGAPGAGGEEAAGEAPGDALAQGGDEGAAEVEGDLDELVKTAAQRDEYLALAQRTQADFENYRKRVARESAAAQERGVAALAKELLPALDNLDRAIGEGNEDGPLLEGVRLVRSELAAALARVGIESFAPVGERFDPSLHEAVATLPQPDGAGESGKVVEVYQAGYRLGESVIRPARVVVSA